MNRILLRKSIGESKLLLLACTALLFVFSWINVWVVSFFETSRFQRVIEPFWEKWAYMSPVSLEHLLSYPGRISLTYIEPAVMLVVAVWAIARGSDSVSGELNRGTLEMMLAQPVSRLVVLRSQIAVMIGGLIVLAAATWFGTAAGVATVSVEMERGPSQLKVPLFPWKISIPFTKGEPVQVPMSDLVDTAVFIPAACSLFSFGFCIAGIATFCSSWDRYRWRSVGLAGGICVLQFIIKGLGVAAEELSWLKKFSFFTAYEPQLFVSFAVEEPSHTWALWRVDQAGQFLGLGTLGSNLILLGIGLAGFLAALVIFARRDLPAPL